MDAWLIQNASMDTTTAAGNGSANAGLVLVEQGSFSAKWNEKKRTYEVFNGGTDVTSARKEEKARQHVADLFAGTHKSQIGKVASSRATPRLHLQPELLRAKRRGTNIWGCKGKPEKEKEKTQLASSNKRARTCRERKDALEPDEDGRISWTKVNHIRH